MSDTPQKRNVLFVDDDKFLVDTYGMKFTQSGYTFEGCLSANQALEIIRGGFSPNIIIFDITMPERDGFSFLEALRSGNLAAGAKLIALTNQSEDAEKKKAEELGVDRYIVKASMIPSEVVNIVGEEFAKSSA